MNILKGKNTRELNKKGKYQQEKKASYKKKQEAIRKTQSNLYSTKIYNVYEGTLGPNACKR